MDKKALDRLVNNLKNNSIEFKFDAYINKGKGLLRSIFIYNSINEKYLKKTLDKNILDNFRIKNTYSWYLGDRKKTLMLELKEELEIEIPEIEQYQINNYA